MSYLKKFSIGFGFIVVAIIFFILGFITEIALQRSWDSRMKHDVRIIKDIDFVNDDVFSHDEPDKVTVRGFIKKDSIGQQTFRKGGTVYVNFPIVLTRDKIEYVDERIK